MPVLLLHSPPNDEDDAGDGGVDGDESEDDCECW